MFSRGFRSFTTRRVAARLFSSNPSPQGSSFPVAAIFGAAVGAGATYFYLQQQQKDATGERKEHLKDYSVKIQKEPKKGIEVTEKHFPDFVDEIPPGYEGRIFRLSQNYPEKADEPLPKFMEIDFKFNPMGYMKGVRDYVYEENLKTNWRPEDFEGTGTTNWYHMPWMHTGAHPREFIHGMTRERDSEPKELSDKQTSQIQNWAVGFYNKVGATTIAKVWKDPSNPNIDHVLFKSGTVVAKILFTAASLDEVPEMEGAVEWQANINSKFDPTSKKAIRTIRLLQMDIAVRDPRADSTTGWVFGTFVYDKNAPGKDGWEKMVPVGVMWGNDPGVLDPSKLKEGFINPDVPAIGKRHLGYHGRLNGPVDNYKSSCLSCHSTAGSPKVGFPPVNLIYPDNADVKTQLEWFNNIPAGKPFQKGQIPLDYSLQLTVAIQNFHDQQAVKATTFSSRNKGK